MSKPWPDETRACQHLAAGQLLQVLFGEDAPMALDAVGSLRALVAAPPTTLDLACQTRLGAFRELVARLIAEPRPRGSA